MTELTVGETGCEKMDCGDPETSSVARLDTGVGTPGSIKPTREVLDVTV